MSSDRPIILKGLYYVLAAAFVLLAVGPALWLANVALQPTSVVRDGKSQAYQLSDVTNPADYTLNNFRGALNIPLPSTNRAAPQLTTSETWARAWDQGLLRPLVNSILVTIAQATLNVVLAALAAYPLARMEFKGRDTLFMIVLATLMVPEQIIAVPLFVTVVKLGLFDTLAAVFIPFSVTAFGIYLCRQAFVAIPPDLEEAARIDGATAPLIWWHVMLPLTTPTLATLAVFSVVGAWSNLLWPLIVLQDEHKHTLPVAINQLLSVFGDNVRFAYAASVMALVPMVVLYALMQKWLQKGLLAGAVKG